jgi:polysaccharide biosynthesis transport protein
VERIGYLRIIWASKGWLALFAVAAAAIVFAISSSEANEYESKALGQIISTSQAEGEILSEEQLLSLSNLNQQLAKTSAVLDLARENPTVKGREAEFTSSVSVHPEAKVGALGFAATTEDPERSAEFANAYADAFSEYLNEVQVSQSKQSLEPLQARINEVSQELRETPNTDPNFAGLQVELQALQGQVAAESAHTGDTMRVVEPAVPHETPVAPKPKRDALLALIGALVLGIATIYLRDLLFDRYRSAEEAARDLGLSLLGEIPKGSRTAPALESFRTLRTAMMLVLEQTARASANGSGHDSGEGVGVLITGAQSGCGKSYVSANLSRTLASEGRRVVAVDADLRRPTLHEAYSVPLSPGLSDLLLRERADRVTDLTADVSLPLDSDPASKLHVLPAGAHAEGAVERLSSEAMQGIVSELRDENDVIVFDSPPTLVVVDPVVLARYADGVLFVVDSRRTRRRDARRAIEALRAMGAPLLGFAFNHSESRQARYDSYRPRELRRQSWQPKKETRV